MMLWIDLKKTNLLKLKLQCKWKSLNKDKSLKA